MSHDHPRHIETTTYVEGVGGIPAARLLLAAAALQGIFANVSVVGKPREEVLDCVVNVADAVLARLEKEPRA